MNKKDRQRLAEAIEEVSLLKSDLTAANIENYNLSRKLLKVQQDYEQEIKNRDSSTRSLFQLRNTLQQLLPIMNQLEIH